MTAPSDTEVERADLLVSGAAEVATALGATALGGAALDKCQVRAGWGVAITDDRILAVGPADDLRRTYRPVLEYDAQGGTLVPGSRLGIRSESSVSCSHRFRPPIFDAQNSSQNGPVSAVPWL